MNMIVKPQHPKLQDRYARDRTSLANERTLLAYFRTAIMLLASGVTLVKFLDSDPHFLFLGYALIPLSFALAVFGYVRFIRMRARIDAEVEVVNGDETEY